MNKKGFTLTELLAVIVIIAVISTVGIVSVSTVRNKMAASLFAAKLEHIVQSAETYGQNNKTLITNSSTSMNVGGQSVKYYQTTVAQLISEGALDTDEKSGTTSVITNNINGANIGTMKIRIYKQYNRYYACIVKNADAKIDNLDDFNYLNYYC